MHLDWNFCAFKKNDTPSGFRLNADYNAVLNILATWQAMSTCGAQEVFTRSDVEPRLWRGLGKPLPTQS